jgi:hypothetical protein
MDELGIYIVHASGPRDVSHHITSVPTMYGQWGWRFYRLKLYTYGPIGTNPRAAACTAQSAYNL